MQIFTFTADQSDCPTKAVAYIHLGADGWLPVVFRAATTEQARADAQKHWDDELDRRCSLLQTFGLVR